MYSKVEISIDEKGEYFFSPSRQLRRPLRKVDPDETRRVSRRCGGRGDDGTVDSSSIERGKETGRKGKERDRTIAT